MRKKLGRILLLLVVAGMALAWYIWNKPHRNVEQEDGIAVSAKELVKAYDSSEAKANILYLDKAISVSGTVAQTGLNQDSFPTITLSSGNAMRSVYCTLKRNVARPAVGTQTIIKGICTGVLSDVTIVDAVIDKP
ncbi:MAG: hypothetical protein ABIX01_09425 [Chitinophagaceae bacterium]